MMQYNAKGICVRMRKMICLIYEPFFKAVFCREGL
jgi:hypothetical protein